MRGEYMNNIFLNLAEALVWITIFTILLFVFFISGYGIFLTTMLIVDTIFG